MEIILLLAVLIVTSILLYSKVFGKEVKEGETMVLNIKDLTMNVKDQLEKIDSIRQKKNEYPLFRIESFDLELNFVIKKTKSSSTAFENELVTITNGQEYSKEQVQKIVLHMKTSNNNTGENPASND